MEDNKKDLAVRRLTALWALSECGMGGILHALKMPFTGVFVGGFALILLCLLAHFSDRKPEKILSALLVVLLIKAGVSPHSPFPAYFAVSFQAFISILIYRLLGIHFLSIFLSCFISLMESAFQKLLFLTLFFGENLWKAADQMIAHISNQFGVMVSDGSHWLVFFYAGIYTLASVLVSVLAWTIYRKIENGKNLPEMPDFDLAPGEFSWNEKRKKSSRIWICIGILVFISVAFWFFQTDKKAIAFEVAKTLIWSITALFLWFIVINPVLTFAIRNFLGTKKAGLRGQVNEAMALFPAFSAINKRAWKESVGEHSVFRLEKYLSLLIYWCLTYSQTPKT